MQAIGDLEALQLGDDVGGHDVFVEIDDGDAGVAVAVSSRGGGGAGTGQLARRRVADVDEGEVGEVDAEEGDAGGDDVLEAVAEGAVVAGDGDDVFEVVEGGFGLGREGVPGLFHAEDVGGVERGEDGHEGVVVVQLEALGCDLHPPFDDFGSLGRVFVL